MNHKILSVLLLLIVAIGFSGVASAATMQKLVTPEWDEIVVDVPAYNITVVDVPEQVIPAVYETITVIDTPEVPGYFETVVDVPEHFDKVPLPHTHVYRVNDQIVYCYAWGNMNANKYDVGYTHDNWVVVDDSGVGNNKKWAEVTKDVFVPATYKEVFVEPVPAVTHEEQRLVTPEQVIPAVTHVEEIPAVTHVVHHEAVFETIEIVNPLPQVIPDEVPLKELPTGGSAVAIAFAALLVLIGGGLVARRMMK